MRIKLDKDRVKVVGDEPHPDDYCLTPDTLDLPENTPANWPVWYAELSDFEASARHAVDTLEARYRAWRGKFEETIGARTSKATAMHAIKREVEATVKFHTFKTAIADANRLAHRYEGWKNAIDRRISLHVAASD